MVGTKHKKKKKFAKLENKVVEHLQSVVVTN